MPYHPMVRKTYDALLLAIRQKYGEDNYGRVRASWKEPFLDVAVGKSSIEKAMSIMDVLLKKIESKGYSVSVEANPYSTLANSWRTVADISGEKVGFGLLEPGKQIKLRLPKKPSLGDKRYDYSLSGRLCLFIKEYVTDGGRTQWSITDNRPTEEILEDFISGLKVTANLRRSHRVELEKRMAEDKARQDEENNRVQRRKEEENRIGQLKSFVVNWDENKRILAFLEELKKSALERFGAIEEESPLALWLNWAKEHINSTEPISRILSQPNISKKAKDQPKTEKVF